MNCIFVNSGLPGQLFGYFPEFFRCQPELFPVKIHVVFALNWDQMDVRMRYFHAQYDYGYPCARYFALDSGRHLLGEYHHAGQRPVVEVENIVHFLFRNHERVSFRKRIDVEECIVVFILCDFVGRNFPCDDA